MLKSKSLDIIFLVVLLANLPLSYLYLCVVFHFLLSALTEKLVETESDRALLVDSLAAMGMWKSGCEK